MYAMGKAGPVDMLAAVGKFLSNPMRLVNEVKELDPFFKHRVQNRALEEFKVADRGRFSTYQNAVGRVGFSAIRLFDRIAYGTGWYAIYQHQLRENRKAGMNEPEAIEAARRSAQEEMQRTQPAANVFNLPELYRTSEALNWFLMFSNQLNKIFNVVTYDTVNSFRQGNMLQGLGYVFGLVLGSIAMGMISRRRWPKSWEEAGADLLNQMAVSIPFGRNLVQGWDGWSGGVDPLPIMWQAGRTAESLFDENRNREADARAVRDLIFESMVLLGAPQVQLSRAMDMLVDENWQLQFEPWELVGGPPEEVPE
jgi:hypothetical protein